MIVIHWLRSLLFLAYGASTASLTATFLLLLFWAPQSWRSAITARYCKMLLGAGDFLCGMKVVLEGEENIPDEPCVIMIKHTTTLETYWQIHALPPQVWVLKRELLAIPLFGWGVGLVLRPIAIEESLRIYSPVQFLARTCTRAIEIEGVAIQPGDRVLFGKYSSNEIEIDGEELLIIKESDVLAIVES